MNSYNTIQSNSLNEDAKINLAMATANLALAKLKLAAAAAKSAASAESLWTGFHGLERQSLSHDLFSCGEMAGKTMKSFLANSDAEQQRNSVQKK